jgi:hypothetical protein
VTGTLFDGAFDGASASRRALHRDRPGREGVEAELVSRLAAGLGPEPARRALVRCLDGELTPRAALAQLLLVTRSVTAVRELVDEVTARADADSRAGDSLVRDRADALTRLVVENEAAFSRALARATAADSAADASGDPPGAAEVAAFRAAAAPPAAGADDEVPYYERVLAGMLAG